jgi:hypothetical protein
MLGMTKQDVNAGYKRYLKKEKQVKLYERDTRKRNMSSLQE